MVRPDRLAQGLCDRSVLFEPTGAYHHAFERRLAKAGLPLAEIIRARPAASPKRSAAPAADPSPEEPAPVGARGEPLRHKADALDMAMLARFTALLEPPSRPVVSAALDEMKKLRVARRALVKDRVAALNRDDLRRAALLLRRRAAERLTQVERQIAQSTRWRARTSPPILP
jgi:transposase